MEKRDGIEARLRERVRELTVEMRRLREDLDKGLKPGAARFKSDDRRRVQKRRTRRTA